MSKGYDSYIKFVKQGSFKGHSFPVGTIVRAKIFEDVEFNKAYAEIVDWNITLTFDDMEYWVECTIDGAIYPRKIIKNDPVNHPSHYTSHPSGVECIQITRHMSFNLGNAIKYIWRADLKNNAIEDLEKAQFYINDEINKRKGVLNGQKKD